MNTTKWYDFKICHIYNMNPIATLGVNLWIRWGGGDFFSFLLFFRYIQQIVQKKV